MRRQFGKTLLDLMKKDDRIVVLIGDVSYGELDIISHTYHDRFFNVGLCEQTIIGMAAGLAHEGLLPVVHSITPFVLERPFEQIKIDIDESNIPVIIMGYDDYPTYGPTHRALDVKRTVDLFKNIKGYYPTDNHGTEKALMDAYLTKAPSFIWLQKSDLPYIPKGGS